MPEFFASTMLFLFFAALATVVFVSILRWSFRIGDILQELQNIRILLERIDKHNRT
jgi:hypothetical protein